MAQELNAHKTKLQGHQAEVYEIEQTMKGLQNTMKEIKDRITFETGVIQSLEFTITLLEQGKHPEET